MKRAAGFTLIEVMVALVIFTLAASMLALMDGTSVRTARTLNEKFLASQIADHYLHTLRLEKQWSGKASTPQVETYAGLEWTVRELSKASDNPNFRWVTVQVFTGSNRPAADDVPVFELTSGFRRPTP